MLGSKRESVPPCILQLLVDFLYILTCEISLESFLAYLKLLLICVFVFTQRQRRGNSSANHLLGHLLEAHTRCHKKITKHCLGILFIGNHEGQGTVSNIVCKELSYQQSVITQMMIHQPIIHGAGVRGYRTEDVINASTRS